MKKIYISPEVDVLLVEYDNLLNEVSNYTIYDESDNGGDSTNQSGSMDYNGEGDGTGMNGAKGNNLWGFDNAW